MKDTIAIIILSNDELELLGECLERIKRYIKFCNYNVYLGYNTSNKIDVVQNMLSNYFPNNHKLITHSKYHFPSNVNDIVKNHLQDEKYILFMNNDVLLEDTGYVGSALYIIQNNQKVGTVGTRLLHGNMKTIQHDGIRIMFTKDLKDYAIVHRNENEDHLTTPSSTPVSVLGNTFALCMVEREVFNKMGGLNESYEKCFEDVEFNLKILKEGYENVTLASNFFSYHLTSYTRNKVEGGEVSQKDIDRIGDFCKNEMFGVEKFDELVELIVFENEDR